MGLSSVPILGVKSFADCFELRFSPGMVGPAGWGRINLIEAIRWALREPSLTVLRASAPRDLIFGGTSQRRAMYRSSVSLIFHHDTFLSAPGDCPLNILDLRELAESSVAEEFFERHRHDRQLIAFTDDNGMMSLCDNMYGITMEESGVSKAVGMRLTRRQSQLLGLTIGTGSPRNFGCVLNNFMSSTALTRAKSSRVLVLMPAFPPTSRAGYP